MLNKKMLLVRAFVLGIVAVSIWGCGSATSNDQGVSFTAIGFFKTFPESADELPAGDAGILVPLGGFAYSRDDEGNFVPIPLDIETPSSVSIVPSIIGTSNNLSGEAIRLTRVHFRYDIEGFSEGFSLPERSYALNGYLAPGSVDSSIIGGAEGNSSSSLPDSFANLNTTAFDEVLVIDQDMMNLLIANKSSLPQLPFILTATAHVTGVTTSGNVIETNEISLPIIITEPLGTTISPTAGSSGSDDSEESGLAE